jgi:hypothetical protein
VPLYLDNLESVSPHDYGRIRRKTVLVLLVSGGLIMIVPPPTGRGGRSLLDLIGQATRPIPLLAAAPPTSLPLTTDHALLVLLGKFAQHLGLIGLLEAVPIPQKTREHRPQTKLIQFLVGILAGLDYLQDFNLGTHPLIADRAVITSWGQAAFAHYSSVSRTLAAADATTVQALVAALQQVSRPFLEREVLALLRAGRPLMIDIDLTGREVSPRSSDYPNAAFGWMDDSLCKGYQAAISSLSGGPSGRVLLTCQRYAGQVKSAECLRAAVQALEQSLGLHPRRRSELVLSQLAILQSKLAATQQKLAVQSQQRRDWEWEHQMFFQGIKPPSERAKRQQARRERLIARSLEQEALLTKRLAGLEAQQAEMQSRLAELEADNASGSSLAPLVVRLDAGFATDANLAYLIEQGYTVLSKAHSGHTSSRLMRLIASEAEWERVGANAEALALGEIRLGEGRYALHALQVRYQLPEGWRSTTLLYYGDTPPPAAATWFGQYNGRQVIEAGIKENKEVFSMRRPLVRSEFGMLIQEQLALFAANLVRWGAAWMRTQLEEAPPSLTRAVSAVKGLVRVLAHSRAELVETELGCALVFDSHSAFAGAVLRISGQVVYQTVLPLSITDESTVQQVT